MGTQAMHISPLSRAVASLMGLVYDNQCPSCQGRADHLMTFPLCSACFGSVIPYTGPACRLCARPFASKYSDTCGDCLTEPPEFKRAMSYGLYEGVLMESIHLLKFSGMRRLRRPLSALLAGMELPEADTIVPVPSTPHGLRLRGFNQSALLAHALSGMSGIPLDQEMLYKVKSTPPQVGLSRKRRMRNLRGAFSATPLSLGKSVILVDDVITTGATMRECARALKHAGAEEVTALSLARTY